MRCVRIRVTDAILDLVGSIKHPEQTLERVSLDAPLHHKTKSFSSIPVYSVRSEP